MCCIIYVLLHVQTIEHEIYRHAGKQIAYIYKFPKRMFVQYNYSVSNFIYKLCCIELDQVVPTY